MKHVLCPARERRRSLQTSNLLNMKAREPSRKDYPTHLVRGVAEKVDDDGSDQHFDHALPRSDGLARSVTFVRRATHVEVPVQFVHAHKETSANHNVADHLKDKRTEVEEGELGELEDDVVFEVGVTIWGKRTSTICDHA